MRVQLPRREKCLYDLQTFLSSGINLITKNYYSGHYSSWVFFSKSMCALSKTILNCEQKLRLIFSRAVRGLQHTNSNYCNKCVWAKCSTFWLREKYLQGYSCIYFLILKARIKSKSPLVYQHSLERNFEVATSNLQQIPVFISETMFLEKLEKLDIEDSNEIQSVDIAMSDEGGLEKFTPCYFVVSIFSVDKRHGDT